MYSFEGEYRRRPQQNFSGASDVLQRDQLVAKARQERLEREQQRKRNQCSIVIQAHIRSFLRRCQEKKKQRNDFDQLLKGSDKSGIELQKLELATRKLLFFYYQSEDSQRLGQLSHLVLQNHASILKLTVDPRSSWFWHIRRLLSLNVDQLEGNPDAAAVPLRLLEIFTSLRTVSAAVGQNEGVTLLARILGHLIPRGYFAKVRSILEARTPPLLVVSSRPPSPLAASLLELLSSPLQLVTVLPPNEFRLLMNRLCAGVFSPRPSEVVRMFVIPALSELSSFPFHEAVAAMYDLEPEYHTPGLLLAMLHLEKRHHAPNAITHLRELIYFLQVEASLTRNLRALAEGDLTEEDLEDFDEKMEVEADQKRQDKEILEECVKLLNDEARVEILLNAVGQTSDQLVLDALCQVCHNLLLSSRSAVHNYRMLYMLAFKPSFLRQLWEVVATVSQTSVFGTSIPLIQLIARGSSLTEDETQRIVPLLAVFCALYTLLLTTLHDTEFYGDQDGMTVVSNLQTNPFHMQELVTMSLVLKDVCLGLVNLAYPESRPQQQLQLNLADEFPFQSSSVPAMSPEQTHMWSNLFKVVVKLLRQIHTRDSHRPFCPENHWISKQVQIILGVCPADMAVRRQRLRGYRPFRGLRAFTREDMEIEGPPLTTKEVRTSTLLQELPFLVPFHERVLIFQAIVMKDKMEHQGEAVAFLRGPSILITVRRNYLYEDSFDRLSLDNEPELRLKMRVELVNKVGLNEVGVDGGGLFREFLTELLKTAFDPYRGFFKLTTDNMLYPNPNVHLIVPNYVDHYFFIGRVLGKALYENLLVELPLAEFFLQKLVSKRPDVDIHHLESLDPVIYKNLLFLKNFDGDVQDLGLDFTILTEELGERRTEELKEDGGSIPVTNSNRIEYIHLVSDYKLNRQIRGQCAAFRAGLTRVIPLEWIHMFNSRELQVLIAGAEVPIDIDDLRENTEYAGGYHVDHGTILLFWQVISKFSDLQKRMLLKFVTSCSRPPLLGFKELDPPFCIQKAGSSDRLPTASTCMNLLKLPEFTDEALMYEKIVYAISAGAGFELS